MVKYSEYAEQVKAFLAGIESEGLIQVKIVNQDLYDVAFGDLNNVFCDLEKHDIRARITKEGLKYIGILEKPNSTTLYLGQNAQLNYQSPDAMIFQNHAEPREKESLAEKLKKIAKAITGVRAIWVALFSCLTFFGVIFSRWKSNDLSGLSGIMHKIAADSDQKAGPTTVPPIWPSNLKYIKLDTVLKFSPSDLIFIAWVKGCHEDSIIAQKLYADMKSAGYQPQEIQELAFIDKMNFKNRQFLLESHLLYNNSRRLLVTINPECNLLK